MTIRLNRAFFLVPLLAIGISALTTADVQADVLPWTSLKNPVLRYREWSIKDFAVAHNGQEFTVFFSAFFPVEGKVRSHVAAVTTPDFKVFSEPLFVWSGSEEGWNGLASPSIQRVAGQWVLTYNSWGDKPGKPNQLFYRTSPDLKHWSNAQPLASNLTAGKRSIDVAVADANGKIMLMWKEDQTPKLAVGTHLSGSFRRLGTPRFLTRDGDSRTSYENYQFLKLDGKWQLLATHMKDNHMPYLFKLPQSGGQGGDWLRWEEGVKMSVARESFNTGHRANAAFLLDARSDDGHFYLFYAGFESHTRDEYAKRGWNGLGISRSRDLHDWLPAGR